MATTYTTNLNLGKPATADRNWGTPLNADLDALDALAPLSQLACALAEVPSASLDVKVAAGTFRKADGTLVTYAGTAARAMTASATNYVYLTDAGVLTVNTAGFPATGNFVAIATVVAAALAITSVADARRAALSMGGHVHWGVGAPTIAAGAGAGTSPTVSVSGTASDQAGAITVLTGTSPAASAVMATITFGAAFSAAPRAVLLLPANAAAAALTGNAAAWADAAAITTTAFTVNVGSSAPAASTTYKWTYIAIG